MAWPLSFAAGAAALLPSPTLGQQPKWDSLPRMQLERQFAGPLQDTVIQRWRDPGDGSICYIYLPFTAPHTPPAPNGYVQYGAASIGSISCFGAAAPAAARAASSAPARPTAKQTLSKQ